MNRDEAELKYKGKGMSTEYVKDDPGKVYPTEQHERTVLYTIGGRAHIRVNNGPWQELQAGDEFVVEENQPHEAIAGTDGWEYVASWKTADAKKFNH